MTPQELAEELLEWNLSPEDAAIMLAIAWAESGLNDAAQGDSINNYTGTWRHTYEPFTCEGFNSFGLFQVFLYWHRDYLAQVTGRTEPCAWASWLKQPSNNVRAALAIRADAGYSAWSTYQQGTYQLYLDQARIFVASAHNDTVPPPTIGDIDMLHLLRSQLASALAQVDELIRRAS